MQRDELSEHCPVYLPYEEEGRARVQKEVSECPVDAMMRVMDGRWRGTILWRLQNGPRRTGELKRSIPGITERMLIRHLQELVADGIVRRDDKKTIPPASIAHSPHTAVRWGQSSK
jgi:DNA-binding HxlR family transcriptional regulator